MCEASPSQVSSCTGKPTNCSAICPSPFLRNVKRGFARDSFTKSKNTTRGSTILKGFQATSRWKDIPTFVFLDEILRHRKGNNIHVLNSFAAVQIKDFSYFTIFFTIYRYMTNSQCAQLPADLIAHSTVRKKMAAVRFTTIPCEPS